MQVIARATGAGFDIQRGEQRRCALPHVIVRAAFDVARSQRQDRGRAIQAWICDFSSTQSTRARSGGARYRPTRGSEGLRGSTHRFLMMAGQRERFSWMTNSGSRLEDLRGSSSNRSTPRSNRPASGTGYAGINRVGVLKLESAIARPI
jgi:hypothetical protein